MRFAIKRPKEVEADQLAAACWYDEQQPGLGDDFLDESEAVIASLADSALVHSIRFANVRCARLKRFKRYGVYYIVHEREVLVLAIHHGARDPRSLLARVKKLT
jgi:plasmid stabilization system protein ParE